MVLYKLVYPMTLKFDVIKLSFPWKCIISFRIHYIKFKKMCFLWVIMSHVLVDSISIIYNNFWITTSKHLPTFPSRKAATGRCSHHRNHSHWLHKAWVEPWHPKYIAKKFRPRRDSNPGHHASNKILSSFFNYNMLSSACMTTWLLIVYKLTYRYLYFTFLFLIK